MIEGAVVGDGERVGDDGQLRVGSANLSNRSLRLDTECDVVVDADANPGMGLDRVIDNVRNDLLAEHLGVPSTRIAELTDQTGSLVQTIERLRRDGHSLIPYEIPDLPQIEEWLADKEILDPEGADDMFESIGKRSLLRSIAQRVGKAGPNGGYNIKPRKWRCAQLQKHRTAIGLTRRRIRISGARSPVARFLKYTCW